MKIKRVDLLRDESKMAGTLARLYGDHACSPECVKETRVHWRIGNDALFLWHVGLRIMENRTWKGELDEGLKREIEYDTTRILRMVADDLGVNAQGWGVRLLREEEKYFERYQASLGIVTIVAVNPRQQVLSFPADRPGGIT